jgi:hypothetical protein
VNRAQRRTARSRKAGKFIKMPLNQAHESADAILYPEENRTVTVEANDRGQLAIGKVFPDITIPWIPSERLGCKKAAWLVVPNLEHNTRHNLPPIYGHTPLDEATPKAIAWVLGCAVRNQGARVMILDISEDLVVRDCVILTGAACEN